MWGSYFFIPTLSMYPPKFVLVIILMGLLIIKNLRPIIIRKFMQVFYLKKHNYITHFWYILIFAGTAEIKPINLLFFATRTPTCHSLFHPGGINAHLRKSLL